MADGGPYADQYTDYLEPAEHPPPRAEGGR
jgi:hypothetical protein